MPTPPVIDGRQFARTASILRGTLEPGWLPRLADMGRLGEVAFELEGGIADSGRATLRMRGSTALETVCQRCLGLLVLPLSVEATLQLCDSELEIAHAQDEVDRVLATGSMNVAELVEDELILELPQTPKHERCTLPGDAQTTVQESPFKTLERLRQPRGAP